MINVLTVAFGEAGRCWFFPLNDKSVMETATMLMKSKDRLVIVFSFLVLCGGIFTYCLGLKDLLLLQPYEATAQI